MGLLLAAAMGKDLETEKVGGIEGEDIHREY
jgi:hypothetical protein